MYRVEQLDDDYVVVMSGVLNDDDIIFEAERYDDGSWEIRKRNGLTIDTNLKYEEMMKIMKEECQEWNKEVTLTKIYRTMG